MKIKKEGNTLYIEIECDQEPRPSGSGKSLLVASETTRRTGVLVKDRELTVSVNAYIKAAQ
jgi:hypothetical protein